MDPQERIELRGQPLGHVPENLQNAHRLRHLGLSKTGLCELPDWLWSLDQLESLNVAENSLVCIAEGIGNLQRLRMLDLGHNQLHALPAALGSLVGLSDYLYVSDNQLSEFPMFLGRLRNLKYLGFTDKPAH